VLCVCVSSYPSFALLREYRVPSRFQNKEVEFRLTLERHGIPYERQFAGLLQVFLAVG